MSSVPLSGLERVSVSLPLAGIGYRTLAYLVDALILFVAWSAAYFGLSLLVSDMVGALRGLSGWVQTALVIGAFAALWIYWTACEALWRGQTLGKRLMKIRVVRLDGSPVGVYECAVRNLLRVVDFLPALYGFGVLSMLVTEQHRRLGDLVAGTLLVREEEVSLEKYLTVPQTQGSPLPSADAELILQFLARAPSLLPDARIRLAQKLFAKYGEGSSSEVGALAPEAIETYLRKRIG